MLGFKKKKKEKDENLTPAEKSEQIQKKAAKILTIFALLVCIVVSVVTVGKSTADGVSDFEKTFSELNADVDTDKLLTSPISTDDISSLVTKSKTSGLDLYNENDVFTNSKYLAENIELTSDITLTGNELGELANNCFNAFGEKYLVSFQQLNLSLADGEITIKSVVTISLTRLLHGTNAKTMLEGLKIEVPSRMYLSTTSVIKENKIISSTTQVNNMSSKHSESLVNMLNAPLKIDLNNYVTEQLLTFIKDLANRSNSDYIFADNTLTFSPTISE